MTIKRILSIFLVVFCFLGISAVSVIASKTEYTWAEGWDVGIYSYVVTKGVDAEVTTEYANSGTYSLKVWNHPEKSTRVWTSVRGLTVGEKYTVSGYVRVNGTLPTGARIRILPDYMSSADDKLGVSAAKTATNGQFVKVSTSFTMPAEPSVVIGLDSGSIPEGCAVYWDDITVEGVVTRINGGFENIIQIKPEEKPEVPEMFTDMAVNGSFETGDGIKSKDGWSAYKGWDNNAYISLTDQNAKKGNWAIKIMDEGNGDHPWVMQHVTVKPGTKYLISVWVRTDEAGSYFRFKFEQYSKDTPTSQALSVDGDHLTANFYPTSEWTQFWYTFSSSIEANLIKTYLRLYSTTGSVYFDDVEIYQLTEPNKITLDTDWCFYREYHEKGTATVMPSSVFDPDGTTVDFTFKDGENVLLSQEKKALTGEGVTFTYPINGPGRLIKEQCKPYDITVTLYGADGNVLETQTSPVYRIDASPYLRKEDNVFLKDKKTPFYPYIAYGTSTKTVENQKKIGVNTIQLNIESTTSLASLDEWLSEAKDSGVMLLVKLYLDMLPPAHPDASQNRIRDIITKCKDHPNVMGYMVMDEPFIWFEQKEAVELLRDSYVFIKSIDPEHPVYILDNFTGTYLKTAKYADMLALDPYPTAKKDPATHIATYTERARKATKGEKAFYAIVQAYNYSGATGYFPNADNYRSSLYQALFEGARGTGFFSWGKSIQNADGTYTSITATDLWATMVEYAKVDMDMAHKVFIGGEIPTLNDVRNEDYWYRLWEKDGKLYLVVLNKDAKNSKTVEIPLTSFDGSLKVGNFSAKIISGGEGSFSGTDVLHATLQPCAAQLWEIMPVGAIDTSGASKFTYYDMNEYGWARKAAETLKEKGITEDADVYAFRPGEKITRAEFAGFLIRTLGLKADSTENFADVTAKTPYASEIDVGRALGILKGTEDNLYNPNAEISRQDFMVIAARGMRAFKAQEEGAAPEFSDAEAIVDYAVLDVLRGYEQENPGGNLTRAEAAVIMDKIAAWSANPTTDGFLILPAEKMEEFSDLLLSGEVSETETVWQGEKEGLLAICNRGDDAKLYNEAVSETKLWHLYGPTDAHLLAGRLSVNLPPHSLVVFSKSEGERRGILKDGIVYQKPVEGGVVLCESDAVAAVYKAYNGIPELTGMYKNGDLLLDGEGMARFFRWDKMQPKQ